MVIKPSGGSAPFTKGQAMKEFTDRYLFNNEKLSTNINEIQCENQDEEE